MTQEGGSDKAPEIRDIFGLKLFGIDLGEVVKSWIGITDLGMLLDPKKIELLRKKIEERRSELRNAQENLRKRFGDAVRFDFDIRVRNLAGGREDFRIGGGRFFEALDQLARERAQSRKAAVYTRREGIIEPYTEIIDANEHIEVIADLPGVQEKDISVDFQQDKMVISTTGLERTYKAEVNLPAIVEQQPLNKSYINGVLKIRLKKSNHPKTN